MKLHSVILLGIFIFVNELTFAQSNSATIYYQETQHFEPNEEMLKRMPKMPTKNEMSKILHIKEDESNYVVNKKVEEGKDVDDLSGKRKRRHWRKRNFDDYVYVNKKSERVLSEQTLFGKKFVVFEDIPKRKWKITATEQRDILGYACMKAEYQDSTQLVTAWFTPQIPLSFGPQNYYGLPGLILAISIGENKIILAESVELNTNTDLKKPKEKKAISKEEYEKIREEKLEERKAMWRRYNR